MLNYRHGMIIGVYYDGLITVTRRCQDLVRVIGRGFVTGRQKQRKNNIFSAKFVC